MTYNQFMKEFREYKLYRIREVISTKYKSQADAAKELGISRSTLSRAMNGAPISDDILFKIVGYGFYNEEIVSPEEFEFRRIERMYKELLAEKRRNLKEKLDSGEIKEYSKLSKSERELIKAREEREKMNQKIAEQIMFGESAEAEV